MDHSRYTISQTAEILKVRESQLRYWEDELELRVHRNGQGHRYYTGYEIQMFRRIMELKKAGLQLRVIREKIPRIAMKAPGSTESRIKLLPMKESTISGERTEDNIASESHRSDNSAQKTEQFYYLLQKMISQEIHRREAEEIRFRALDERIRECQLIRKETASTIIKRKI